MEEKLHHFLDKAFTPYGDFPARTDVTNELLTNLVEKYQDLKKQGMSDDEAYQAAIDSFGNVEEIMEHVPHDAKNQETKPEREPGLRKTLKQTLREAKALMGLSKFGATVLKQADLSDSNLAGEDFSYSALNETVFDRSDLNKATFRAAAITGASFADANLSSATFAASALEKTTFNGANLSGTKFHSSALKGATFAGAMLTNTDFHRSDLGSVSFDDQELNGVIFNGSALKKTSFRNTTLLDVSFHHTDVKHAIFDGAKMDKVTYALLKGAGAAVENVKIV